MSLPVPAPAAAFNCLPQAPAALPLPPMQSNNGSPAVPAASVGGGGAVANQSAHLSTRAHPYLRVGGGSGSGSGSGSAQVPAVDSGTGRALGAGLAPALPPGVGLATEHAFSPPAVDDDVDMLSAGTPSPAPSFTSPPAPSFAPASGSAVPGEHFQALDVTAAGGAAAAGYPGAHGAAAAHSAANASGAGAGAGAGAGDGVRGAVPGAGAGVGDTSRLGAQLLERVDRLGLTGPERDEHVERLRRLWLRLIVHGRDDPLDLACTVSALTDPRKKKRPPHAGIKSIDGKVYCVGCGELKADTPHVPRPHNTRARVCKVCTGKYGNGDESRAHLKLVLGDIPMNPPSTSV